MMANCPKCGGDIRELRNFCPGCGVPLSLVANFATQPNSSVPPVANPVPPAEPTVSKRTSRSVFYKVVGWFFALYVVVKILAAVPDALMLPKVVAALVSVTIGVAAYLVLWRLMVRNNHWAFPIAAGAAVATFGLWHAFAEQPYEAVYVEKVVLKAPLLQAIKKYEPAAYREFARVAKAWVANGASYAEISEQGRPLIRAVVVKHAPSASDTSIRAATTATVDTMKQVYALGGDTCYALLVPQSAPPLSTGDKTNGQIAEVDPVVLRNVIRITEKTAEAGSTAQAEMIRTSVISPQRVPTEAEIESSRERLMAILSTKYDQTSLAMFDDPRAIGIDKRKFCAMTIDLYTEALRMPPEQGSKFLRFMISEG